MIAKYLSWLCAALLIAASASHTSHAQGKPANDNFKQVSLAEGQFERGAALPAWVDPIKKVPSTQDKGPLVMLFSDAQFLASAKPAYFARRIWQVNAPSALDDLGRYTIEFNPSYERLQLHHLRIVRGSETLDKLASTQISFLQREAGLEQQVYSGKITTSILVDDLRVGDQLDIAYTVSGENPVFGGKYLQLASWDQSMRTEMRRVSLLKPVERKINWQMRSDANAPVVQPQITMVGGMQKLQWEALGMERMEGEYNVPSSFEPFRYLQFSEFQSWNDVAKWGHQLFQYDATASNELQALVARIKTQPSQEERAAEALAWVQNNIRYFSLTLGESSHRPSAPNLTLNRRYGDCKDKSTLLIYLLKELGLKAQPVLLSATARRDISKLLPSPYAFDHVIVRVEVNGKPYFLDPTRQGQGGKLSAMGQAWEDAEVLVISPDATAFTDIRSENYADISRDEMKEKIRFNQFADFGELDSTHTWTGVGAEIRRVNFTPVPKETLAKYALQPYEARYPGATLVGDVVLTDDPVRNVFTMAMRLKLPKLVANPDGSWFMRFRPENIMGSISLPQSAVRRYPFALAQPSKRHYELEVEFPSEVSVVSDPITRSVRNPHFDYNFTLGFRGNRAVGSYDLSIFKTQVDADKTGEYMTALRRTSEIDSNVFVVRKEDIKSGTLFGLGKPTLKEMIAKRQAATLEKIDRALASEKLTGDDVAYALCDRAENLADMGRVDEALKSAQQAMKNSPNLARAFSCRANIQFLNADYAKAISDYTKAITLAPEETEVYYRRGQARYYAGQLAGAADDFGKVGVGGKGEEDTKLYGELWRVWTLRRLGRQPNTEQVQAAAADPRGEWPRPALAMLHDLMPVDEMLSLVKRKKGDDLEMALAEAYFYAGQWYLLQGDKARAAEYFRKTQAQGITMYIEHVSAGIELKQMAVGK